MLYLQRVMLLSSSTRLFRSMGATFSFNGGDFFVRQRDFFVQWGRLFRSTTRLFVSLTMLFVNTTILLRPFGAVFLFARLPPPVSPGVIDIASFQDASGLKPTVCPLFPIPYSLSPQVYSLGSHPYGMRVILGGSLSVLRPNNTATERCIPTGCDHLVTGHFPQA